VVVDVGEDGRQARGRELRDPVGEPGGGRGREDARQLDVAVGHEALALSVERVRLLARERERARRGRDRQRGREGAERVGRLDAAEEVAERGQSYFGSAGGGGGGVSEEAGG